jgi:hypothetical protein
MRPITPRRATQPEQPQHIADILPDVLARYGLDQPAEAPVWPPLFTREPTRYELPVVELTADLALPLSLS